MSDERHKAIIRRLFDEVVNRRNSAVLDELIAPSLAVGAGLPDGPNGVQAFVDWLHTVFADLEYRVEEIIAEGNLVAARLTATGVQVGDYLGHPRTGKVVEWDEVVFARVVNEQIVEWWIVADRLMIMEQIGAVRTA